MGPLKELDFWVEEIVYDLNTSNFSGKLIMFYHIFLFITVQTLAPIFATLLFILRKFYV